MTLPTAKKLKHTPKPDSTLPLKPVVRPATAADAAAIAALVQELGYPARRAEVSRRLARLAGRKDYLTLVAESESGQVCGWMQAHSSEVLESGFRVEIMGLVIGRALRRRGLGRLLVQHAESWAASLGAPVVVVRSNISRSESHRFYPALGYEHNKTQKVYRKLLK